jgi:hypothetical protein
MGQLAPAGEVAPDAVERLLDEARPLPVTFAREVIDDAEVTRLVWAVRGLWGRRRRAASLEPCASAIIRPPNAPPTN